MTPTTARRTLYVIRIPSGYPQIAQDGRIVRWHACHTDAAALPRQQAEELAQKLGDFLTDYSTAGAKEARRIRLVPLTGGAATSYRYEPAR